MAEHSGSGRLMVEGTSLTARVSVDSSLCAAHGRCYDTAPNLFVPDGDGYATTTHDAVSGTEREHAERAAGLCPEMAIRLSEIEQETSDQPHS